VLRGDTEGEGVLRRLGAGRVEHLVVGAEPGVVQPPQGLGDGAAVADAGVEDEVPQRAGDGGVLLAQNPIKEGVGDGEEW